MSPEPNAVRRLGALHGLAIALLAALCVSASTVAAASAAQPHPFRGDRTVTVMTRNLYLGTDLRPILGAPSVPALLSAVGSGYANVEASRFAERADAVAAEIAAAQPDLVGLQEVALYRIDVPPDGPASPGTTVTYDFLELLLAALEARGVAYEPVAVYAGLDAELPAGLPPRMDVRFTNRDVILARSDLKTADLKLSNAQSGGYATNLVVNTMLGPVTVRRGWAAVDVKIRGKSFRFISTHLEAFSPYVQVAQGAELVAGPTATDLPVVVVGDLNSRADGRGTPTYANLLAAGFVDAWTDARPSETGFTCCHAADLRSATRVPDTRIDFVLSRGGFTAVAADLVGEEPADRTVSGLWPSDHAGVVATLELP